MKKCLFRTGFTNFGLMVPYSVSSIYKVHPSAVQKMGPGFRIVWLRSNDKIICQTRPLSLIPKNVPHLSKCAEWPPFPWCLVAWVSAYGWRYGFWNRRVQTWVSTTFGDMDPEIREYIFDFGFGSVTLLDQRQTFDCFSIRTKWVKLGFRKQ